MLNYNIVGVGNHGRVDLLFRAHRHVDERQKGADVDAERARVAPLVGAEVEVEKNGAARALGLFRGEKGRRYGSVRGSNPCRKFPKPSPPATGAASTSSMVSAKSAALSR